ncbi:arylsulfatase [Rhizobiales bacterium GAS188]|nr:arylsulfatase [Rhizobiales bacterium GAS188]
MDKRANMCRCLAGRLLLTYAVMTGGGFRAQEAIKPNILVIMGDDIGWENVC